MFTTSQIILGVILAITFLVFAVSFALKRRGWIIVSLSILGLYTFGNIFSFLFC